MAQLAALVAVTKQVPEWHHLDTGGTAVGKTHAALVGVAGRRFVKVTAWRVSREPAIILSLHTVPRGCKWLDPSLPGHTCGT